jgi:SAM-dependent methyltransferase
MSTPTATVRKADPGHLATHPEIRKVMRPLSEDELARLERNILRDGIREPLSVWTHDGHAYVIDGHHRLEVARRHGLPVPLQQVEGLETLEDALAWAIENQLGRRNLTDNERADLIGREYLLAEKRRGARTDRTSRHSDAKFPARDRKTSAAVAKKHRVSPETVERAARFSQALDALARAVGDEDGVRRTVLAADSPFSRKDVILLAATAQSNPSVAVAAFRAVASGREKSTPRALASAKRELARSDAASKGMAAELPASVRILHGDFRSLCSTLPGQSVDLVLTDPPYDRDSLPLWEALARESSRILKPGGYLVAYTGQYVLPEVLDSLRKHLSYYWVLCLPFDLRQNHLRLWEKRLWNAWKPVVVFTAGTAGSHSWTSDVIRIPSSEKTGSKDLHDWGQPVLEARILIEAFCPSAGTVLDPMCGSGTVPLAAALCKRHAIGMDVDESSVLRARARLSEALRGGKVS